MATPEQKKQAAAYAKEWRKAHPENVKAARQKYRSSHRAEFNAGRRDWRRRNIERALFMEAKSRAKARGVEFAIALDDVPPKGAFCPLLGLPFIHAEKGRHPQAPSLDRIDPGLGYVRGNVWIVGYRANLIKNDGTADEHEAIALAMRKAHS